METTLDMRSQNGTFIGSKAPFGYQKSEASHNQLIPDPKAAIIVRKIFESAPNGLSGDYDDGIGDWNSRLVNYILTYRAYTGMFVHGKEKRAIVATHEPLVDVATFDGVQKSF